MTTGTARTDSRRHRHQRGTSARLPGIESQRIWLARAGAPGSAGRRRRRRPWLSVVNLNLRALTSAPVEGESIVQQLLARMSDQRLWSACGTCAIQQSCYANANAERLRDPVLVPARLNVFGRRSIWSDSGGVCTSRCATSCPFGVRRSRQSALRRHRGPVRERRADGHSRWLHLNALFAAADVDLVDTQGAEKDRLLAQLAPLDVSARPMPEEDARLWLRGTDALPAVGQTNREPDRAMLQECGLPPGSLAGNPRTGKVCGSFMRRSAASTTSSARTPNTSTCFPTSTYAVSRVLCPLLPQTPSE